MSLGAWPCPCYRGSWRTLITIIRGWPPSWTKPGLQPWCRFPPHVIDPKPRPTPSWALPIRRSWCGWAWDIYWAPPTAFTILCTMSWHHSGDRDVQCFTSLGTKITPTPDIADDRPSAVLVPLVDKFCHIGLCHHTSLKNTYLHYYIKDFARVTKD